MVNAAEIQTAEKCPDCHDRGATHEVVGVAFCEGYRTAATLCHCEMGAMIERSRAMLGNPPLARAAAAVTSYAAVA